MVTQPKLFALNTLLLISLLLQLTIGIWLFLITHGFVTDPTTCFNLHVINGLILVGLAVVHVYMNRRWIRLQLKGPRTKKRNADRARRTKKIHQIMPSTLS